MSKKGGSIRLDKEAGINPTIPVCHYCGKEKNEIILTGAAGGKWARENGHADGHMPMLVFIENDVVPCDECKKKGVAIAEISDEDQKKLTGRRWLVTEDFVRRLLQKDKDLLEKALEVRVMLMPEEFTKALGLVKEEEEEETVL